MGAFSQNWGRGTESIMRLRMGTMEQSPRILQSIFLLGISTYITNALFVNYR